MNRSVGIVGSCHFPSVSSIKGNAQFHCKSCSPVIQTIAGLQGTEVEPSEGSRRAHRRKTESRKVGTQAEQLNDPLLPAPRAHPLLLWLLS
jgi:hypothetical protein